MRINHSGLHNHLFRSFTSMTEMAHKQFSRIISCIVICQFNWGFLLLYHPCVCLSWCITVYTIMVCGGRLKRGLTFTSAFLAAGGHTATSHEHTYGLPHTHKCAWLIHTHTLRHLLADNTIETALPVNFLPLLNPDCFRVATPKLWAGWGKQELCSAGGRKKKPSSLWFFSAQDGNPSHCRTQANEKVLLLWSCGDPV